VRQGDSDFVRKFEQAIPLGIPILLEGASEQLPHVLSPLLEKRINKVSGSYTLEFGDSVLDYSEEFRFYITTKLPNPHLLPEITTKVTVVNFVITNTGLRNQLLDIIIQRENSQLDEEQRALI
jgi:dynein heavy chain